MAFAKVWLETQRLHSLGVSFLLSCFDRFKKMVDITRRGGEPCVSESEIGIESNCLFKEADRGFKILEQVVRSRLVVARPQVEDIGVGVVRRFGFDACFFLRGESGAQRISNSFCHFSLNREDIG